MRQSFNLVLVATFLVCASAYGQTNSYYGGSSSQGLFGTNTVGGGQATNTGGSLGGSGGGSGGGTTAQNPFSQQNAALGGISRPQIQTTQQPGDFVGADRADTTNPRSMQSTQTRSAQATFAQLGNLFAQGMQSVEQNNNTQNRNRPNIRIALRLGFRPAPVTQASAVAFQSRLLKLPGIRFSGPAQVTLEGRTAVLKGTVASEEDRELAQALAMMEPDVLDVQNELVVDSSATVEEELPAASPSDRTSPAPLRASGAGQP
jgi:osmotically-inducible protein OsmY